MKTTETSKVVRRLAEQGHLIGDAWSPSDSAGVYEHRYAATGEVQAEVAKHSLPKQLPVLALSAGQRTLEPQEHRDRFHVSHEKIAAAALAPYSRHRRIDGATHMSMLTAPHAETVAMEILSFARQTASARLAA